MWKSFRGLAAENVEKNSVGGCQAATCGHLRLLEWLQVAAENVEEFPGQDVRRPFAAGYLRALAATRVAASGCH